MRKTSQQYVKSMMCALPSAKRRGSLSFPAPLFNAEKKPKKKEPEKLVSKIKVKAEKKKEKVEVDNSFDPFDF